MAVLAETASLTSSAALLLILHVCRNLRLANLETLSPWIVEPLYGQATPAQQSPRAVIGHCVSIGKQQLEVDE